MRDRLRRFMKALPEIDGPSADGKGAGSPGANIVWFVVLGIAGLIVVAATAYALRALLLIG